MEKLFEQFDAVMEEMNDAVTAATTPEEQEKIQKSFEKKIDAAEKKLEAGLEKSVKESDAALEAEHKAAEKAITRQEEEDEKKIKKIQYTTDHTVKEMRAEAKVRGIVGYSRMREAELINVLNS